MDSKSFGQIPSPPDNFQAPNNPPGYSEIFPGPSEYSSISQPPAYNPANYSDVPSAPSFFPETPTKPALSSEPPTKLVDVPTFDRSTKPSAPPPISPPPPSAIPSTSYPSVPDRSSKPGYQSQGSVSTSGLRTVTVPTAFMREFLSIAASNTARNVETCGILGGKLAKNSFVVSHLVIPKQ